MKGDNVKISGKLKQRKREKLEGEKRRDSHIPRCLFQTSECDYS